MCGIFGATGKENVITKTMTGIKSLEYRGYDSAGIAFFQNNKIEIIKKMGQISVLENELKKQKPESTCAIAHTRWATHGKPSDANAHPHFSKTKQFALVHNGIIENHESIKKEYLADTKFESTTDTEVAACLIEKFFKSSILQATQKACEKMKGSFAFAIVSTHEPNKIILAKNESPMFVGVTKNEVFFASDTTALSSFSNEIYAMKNHEFAEISNNEAKFFNNNLQQIKKEKLNLKQSSKQESTKNFKHHMQKEIYEIPEAIKKTFSQYASSKTFFNSIPKKILKRTKKIKIVACGTAFHAGLVGKKIIETKTKIEVETEIASEFRYGETKLSKNTLCIFISQSGETADTIAAVKICKSKKIPTLAITNVQNSSITFEADHILFTNAGPEIAVASTKAYNCQLAILFLIATVLESIKKSEKKN